MKNRKVMEIIKKTMTGLLVATMVITGVVVSPVQADAATGDEIIWEEYSKTDMEKVYTATSKTAPECKTEGYVFAGWYTGEETAAYNVTKAEKAIYENETTIPDKVYAKFVPSYVLSVKGQNKEDTTNKKTTIRVASSVDSLHYSEVGMTIYLKNDKTYNVTAATATTKVYTEIYGDDVKHTPKQLFGAASNYFVTHNLNNIPESMYADIMYIRPYWITYDGTKVEGLAKHLRVDDEGYVCIPVNLYTAEEIAAGVVSVTYDNTALKFSDTLTASGGRLFEEFACTDKTGTVKMVGNVEDISANKKADTDVYAMLRFEVVDSSKVVSNDTNFLSFTVTADDFCKIDESGASVDKYAWDIRY